MPTIKEILTIIEKKIFHSNHQTELENYINSKYPKNCSDIEHWTIEYYNKVNKGIL